MKRIYTITTIVSLLLSGAAMGQARDNEEPQDHTYIRPQNSNVTKEKQVYSMSAAAGVRNGTDGFTFGLTRHFKSGTEVGGIFNYGRVGMSGGVTLARNLRWKWVFVGFTGGVDFGTAVTGTDGLFFKVSTFWGYKYSLMLNYGFHAGFELPIGIGMRFHVGASTVVAHSKYEKLVGTDDGVPANQDGYLPHVALEAFIKF
ncbi:hypothetical protein KKF34_19330 [Myxococcota bacterium]|nr:hypothetical protein [Myxococcota bacterium]MBU1380589.1 hypothetical protein [Myxococcota bacterium]MBU1499041.1 hypothetical protein [Myxococcota bacterium]